MLWILHCCDGLARTTLVVKRNRVFVGCRKFSLVNKKKKKQMMMMMMMHYNNKNSTPSPTFPSQICPKSAASQHRLQIHIPICRL
mmetsp:Transcript_5847/g.13223  ORF Transcript_5847/g.13223 Transcript_5847/m.13223 type:complete len:85 (+) Transcript_5847:639-893(+)